MRLRLSFCILLFLNIYILSHASSDLIKDEFLYLSQNVSKINNLDKIFKFDYELDIQKKTYIQKSHKATAYDIQILINKSDMTIEEIVKFNLKDSSIFKLNELKSVKKPKCLGNDNLLKYNIEQKIIALYKKDKLVWVAHSNLIEDRLKDDSEKKCLKSWSH